MKNGNLIMHITYTQKQNKTNIVKEILEIDLSHFKKPKTHARYLYLKIKHMFMNLCLKTVMHFYRVIEFFLPDSLQFIVLYLKENI